MKHSFKHETYFDLSDFPFRDIFNGIEHVWEVVGKIEQYTKGELLMGKNSSVDDMAIIRGGVILGNDVKIGKFVELKNCIVMNHSFVLHFSYIGDSILGNSVNISAGAKIANLRFDHKNVHIKQGNEIIDTKLEKFGLVLGDHSVLGANSVTNPGTLIGKHSVLYPLSCANGVYSEGSIIK